MEIATIQGERRERAGRRSLHRLRARGFVPGVIYGHNKPPENVALSKHELLLAIEHGQRVVQLAIGDKQTQYLLKDVQYDHLQFDPLHADLMRVDLNERVKVKVPVELRGDAHGAHEGGVLVTHMSDIELECSLLEIPDHIRVEISQLGVNESLSVKEVSLPEGVTAVAHPDEIVVTCTAKRGVSESEEAEGEEAEAAGDEPEVIGRAAKEGEGEAEASK